MERQVQRKNVKFIALFRTHTVILYMEKRRRKKREKFVGFKGETMKDERQ